MKPKLGSLPKTSTSITPVPGAPLPVQQNNSVRPTAVGVQNTAVKSPKAKMPEDVAKSEVRQKGVMKLKGFMDTKLNKKNIKKQ